MVLADIWKADGSESNYRKVLADVCNEYGDQMSTLTEHTVRLGEATMIYLLQVYPAGTRVRLRMKGNNESLDCIVSFTASISQ